MKVDQNRESELYTMEVETGETVYVPVEFGYITDAEELSDDLWMFSVYFLWEIDEETMVWFVGRVDGEMRLYYDVYHAAEDFAQTVDMTAYGYDEGNVMPANTTHWDELDSNWFT